ncbi:unannotated protein [freshwater metagenome]|uniref:Unannotated protein n=1 Tax=freshwater metagenome TaxID=449393 RepID=A0A6J7K8A4_9ZZZZ|nr:hypothetical protein [Actinomycetota bacterium]
MSPASSVPGPPAPRRDRTRRAAGLGVLAAVGAASLLAPSAASAERVTSLKPWTPTSQYVAKNDIDGRAFPRMEPRTKVDYLRKGQWVRITCQAVGESAYGSTIWDRVGDLWVPDQQLKTYTDGFLPKAPRCPPGGVGPVVPTPGTTPPATEAPSPAWLAAREAGFGSSLPGDVAKSVVQTGARTKDASIIMLRFFIPNGAAGGRLLKGDGRGWSKNPSQSVASRASLFWDTETGRTSLTISPTHLSDKLPRKFWGLKRYSFKILGSILLPHQYALPSGLYSKAALPISMKSSESDVRSTDLKARSTNDAYVSGSGKKITAKISLLNSVTNSIGVGSWSVDDRITIEKKNGRFAVTVGGNGYPAIEVYRYPKKRSIPTSTLFLRRIHENAFARKFALKAGVGIGGFGASVTLKTLDFGAFDPGGGIAALDYVSKLICVSSKNPGSLCIRSFGGNPIAKFIAPAAYTTTSGSDPG